jgi:hypothetical protein
MQKKFQLSALTSQTFHGNFLVPVGPQASPASSWWPCVVGVPCIRVRNQTLFFGTMCVENVKLIPTCRINFLNFPWQLPGPCRPAGGSPASCGACTKVCSVQQSKNKALVFFFFWGSKYRECKKQLQLSALTSRPPHGKVKAQTLIFGVTCAGSVKVQLIT